MKSKKQKNPLLGAWVLILLAYASGHTADASGTYPAVRSALTPRRATVGEPLDYRVILEGRDVKTYGIAAPEKRAYYPDEKSKNLEKKSRPSDSVPVFIIHEIKKETSRSPSGEKISVIMQISYYRPGRHVLPEIEIRDPQGARIAYNVPEVEIAAVNKNGQAEDIEPPLDLGGNYARLWILLAAAAAAGALGYGAFRFIRNRRSAESAAVPPVPPLEAFLDEIRQFSGEGLIDEGRVEDYVFGISMIFRRFLSAEMGFDATDMTSEEILRALKKNSARTDSGPVADCLNLWDLAKFAEFAPSKDTLRANLESTIKTARRIAWERDDGIHGV